MDGWRRLKLFQSKLIECVSVCVRVRVRVYVSVQKRKIHI